MSNLQASSLHIIADANIWGAKLALATLDGLDVQLDILEHAQINAASVKNADVLLVRSATKVNKDLLQGSAVRFVGTATIGDDHIDKAYLRAAGIGFASAAGSSTESVVEYMLASLFLLQEKNLISLQQDCLGIIGVGRIGSLLQTSCDKLGLATLCNDPPRQRTETQHKLHDLNHLLQHADILTLHTPLITSGEDNSIHLLNAQALGQFQGRGIINAGRGACLDNAALLSWLEADHSRFSVLDCWENEPNINKKLLQHPQVTLVTPHIAGHSLDGKAANTLFVYRALCEFLSIQPSWDVPSCLPTTPTFSFPTSENKANIAMQLYPIAQDSQAMKHAATEENFSVWFQTYRRNYPVRRSWKNCLKHSDNMPEDLFF